MKNIILNIIFYFLLTFLWFLMMCERYSINKNNRIHESFTTIQQVINTDPFGRKHISWNNLKPKKVSNKSFNIFKYIDDGLDKYNVNTIQDVYQSRFEKYNSLSL